MINGLPKHYLSSSSCNRIHVYCINDICVYRVLFDFHDNDFLTSGIFYILMIVLLLVCYD